MAIRLETWSQESVQNPSSLFFFFFPLGLLVERITHLANIWAAEEHKCFVPSPNGTCFSEAASGTPCTEAACLHEHAGGHDVPTGDGPLLALWVDEAGHFIL